MSVTARRKWRSFGAFGQRADKKQLRRCPKTPRRFTERSAGLSGGAGRDILSYRIIMKNLKRPRVRTNIKENTGKLLLDVAKLTFGSFILGGILRGELPQYILIITGFIVSVACAILGLLWTSKKQDMSDKG